MERGATLTPDGLYRYRLTRRWGPGRCLGWVMLNPSTADAMVDDPTIRRCIGFARRDGFEAISVVNLFAVRLTDSRRLTHTASPFGPDNIAEIGEWAWTVDRAVAAWGAHPMAPAAARHVLFLVTNGAPYLGLECLGTTKDGHPRHPLYVSGNQPFVPFSVK